MSKRISKSNHDYCMIPSKNPDDIDKHNNCSLHEIIEDYIDIDLDRGQQIFYCHICFATFFPVNKVINKLLFGKKKVS